MVRGVTQGRRGRADGMADLTDRSATYLCVNQQSPLNSFIPTYQFPVEHWTQVW